MGHRIWIGGSILVVILWGAMFQTSHPDAFGALETLFTGLALAAAIAAVVYERAESKAANDSLRAETADLRAQASAQEKARKLDRFESVLFNLLNTHRQIINEMSLEEINITFSPGDVTTYSGQGRRVLREFKKAAVKAFRTKENAKLLKAAQLQDQYDYVYKYFENCVGHYYRSLFHIFRFIDTECPSDKKEFYAKLVRAQLSGEEVGALYVNCLFAKGRDFKPLVEMYKLLKHMPASEESAKNWQIYFEYAPSAFDKVTHE